MSTRTIFSLLAGLIMVLLANAAAVWAAACGDTTGPGGTDVPCSCGDTVTTETTLTSVDPIVNVDPAVGCPFDGLTVAGVHLDLGGHTIYGAVASSGPFAGLLLEGSNGAVSHGRIQNFGVGIGGLDLVGWDIVPEGSPGLTVTQNLIGVLLFASSTRVSDVAVISNVFSGILAAGDENQFIRLTCSKNGEYGLFVAGNANELDHNRCERNGLEGIAVSGNDNRLIRNYGASNAGTGVLAEGDRNEFETNQGVKNGGGGVVGVGDNLVSNGRNTGSKNAGVNCSIQGFSTQAGRC
jgi:hypothetical protein